MVGSPLPLFFQKNPLVAPLSADTDEATGRHHLFFFSLSDCHREQEQIPQDLLLSPVTDPAAQRQ